MNDYFQGTINQLLERGQLLFSKIPTGLPREFHLLAQSCQNRLHNNLDKLRALIDDPKMLSPIYQSIRLRQLRRVVWEMDLLETVGIAALNRANSEDRQLNQLIECIGNEISYPLLPPVVTSLSQAYFQIHPQLNLLGVPLSEGDFLLHLPDLYHELAHPLITEKYNSRVKSFQSSLAQALAVAHEYTATELQKEDRRRSPAPFSFYLRQWLKCWVSWAIEFFCDLFAVYTVGPAFAWAHLHLHAKRGGDPFQVPTLSYASHPADDARMKTILYGLCLAGFSQEAKTIHKRWKELISLSGAKPEPEYHRCFPEHILEYLAQKALEGTSSIGCRIATLETRDPVYNILNQAWTEFWRDPKGYTTWEKAAVKRLREQCSTSILSTNINAEP